MDSYKELIHKLKLDDKVLLVGKVPYEEMPNYYQLADIFVTASKTETQGLTVIEAMAAGITPVCIKDESFEDAIIDGLNGRFFENKRDYVKIINELIDHPEELAKYSHQARLNAESHSSKYYADRVLDIYRSMTKKEKKGFFGKLADKFKRKDDEDD